MALIDLQILEKITIAGQIELAWLTTRPLGNPSRTHLCPIVNHHFKPSVGSFERTRSIGLVPASVFRLVMTAGYDIQAETTVDAVKFGDKICRVGDR